MMKWISQIGVIGIACAALVGASHALGQASACQALPNGEFEQDLDGWIIEPEMLQEGNASASVEAYVVDGSMAGALLDGQVLLMQANASAVGLADATDGASYASAELVVKAPKLVASSRYLTFAVGGGFELIAFGGVHSNLQAQIQISPTVPKQLQHQLGSLAFPPFQICEFGISVLGTFQQDGLVVIDLLLADGQPTGIELGDAIELTITLHCEAYAGNPCDDGLMAAALFLDDFRFCEAPPGIVPGDITGDGLVNSDDLLSVIGAWGACSAPPMTCPEDLTGDLTVDVDDLLAVIQYWT